jgi:hypothetical protein
MPPKKRDTPFQAHHVDEFGLRIRERAVGNSTAVVTTACRFCEVFGKEESEVGMKRGRSDSSGTSRRPFVRRTTLRASSGCIVPSGPSIVS